MRRMPALFLCLALWGVPGSSQESGAEQALREAITELTHDIRKDTESLNRLRAEIDAERTPLAERMEVLRNQVAEQRAELDRIRRVQTQGQRDQAALESRTAALEEEVSYLRALFAEYGRAMDTRMSAARPPELMEALDPVRRNLDQDGDLAAPLEELLSISGEWNQDRIGGRIFRGAAVDDAGIQHPGTFAAFGPVAYFASAEEDGPVGLALLRFGSDRPAVYQNFPADTREAIRSVTEGETASLPVDASGGDAIRIEEATPGLWQHLQQGGFTMIPLALVGLGALILAVWKGVDLARMRVKNEAQVEQILTALRSGDLETARQIAGGVPLPMRRLVDDLIQHRDAPREHLEEIMHEHVLVSLPYIERNLGALAVLGGVAPLLGLLGTVTGMIHTFQLVTLFGSGDAKLLSGGISEALVTTETGLAIAIPTLLIHAYLARRARGIVGGLEVQAATMINDLKLRT